ISWFWCVSDFQLPSIFYFYFLFLKGYRVRSPLKALPLDMAPNSVDDAYSTCTKEMSKRVLSKYLTNELNSNADFKKAWNWAKKYNKHKNPGNGLTENHAIAIRVYTNGHPKVYDKFNEAVHVGKETEFNYHALHFLLTDALKHLKENQKRGKCLPTYRRTELDSHTKVNQEIRFGYFTSTSLKKGLTRFGKRSCFEIETCHGAALEPFSNWPEEEAVLIPPYEKFKVKNIRKHEKKDWCDVVYILSSTGH
ncbi:ecto-ADP-ribosyltransferase 5-like, partial [Clupea harengus]|uniref:NAD(P)(+)--arginine ADP-ribosyltransferase n=1 Tax=Clupea harengus TaxID=7950 RepID=A0A6P8EJG2_CLUHA